MNYLHLGKGTVVDSRAIVGIFDLDITSQSHLTRKFLSLAEKAGLSARFRIIASSSAADRITALNDNMASVSFTRMRNHTVIYSTPILL